MATVTTTCFWWNERKNFGDALTALILEGYGVRLQHAPVTSARLVGIGSVAQLIPPDYTGTILGTGFISAGPLHRLAHARVLALRGPLTKYRCGEAREVTLGDLGLLVDRLVETRPSPQVAIGIVPHYQDKDDPVLAAVMTRLGSDARLIDVEAEPVEIARAISGCGRIFSSSLHGLIAADAFGIPANWLVLSDKVIGNGFKFFDHALAVGVVERPVYFRGDETVDVLLAHVPRSPVLAPMRQRTLHDIVTNFAQDLRAGGGTE